MVAKRMKTNLKAQYLVGDCKKISISSNFPLLFLWLCDEHGAIQVPTKVLLVSHVQSEP